MHNTDDDPVSRSTLLSIPGGEFAVRIVDLVDSGTPFAEIEVRAEELHLREAVQAILSFEPRLVSDACVIRSLREESELVLAENDFEQLRESPTPCPYQAFLQPQRDARGIAPFLGSRILTCETLAI